MQRVTVPIRRGCSDGDATHRPNNPAIREIDPPTIYLEKIGTLWMKDRGQAISGITYILDSLPPGYALFQKQRLNTPAHMDKWLYGHPSHKVFDSPNRFFPHFKHLMNYNGNSIGCPCTVCNARGGVIPPIGVASSSSVIGFRPQTLNVGASLTTAYGHKGHFSKKVAPGMDTRRVDEEGTPDVYRNLIDKLKANKTVDEPIIQPMSMDWRSDQETLGPLKESLKEPQWVPRTGEIVLFIRDIPEGYEACWTDEDVQFYNPKTRAYAGYPTWEAGLVGQAPREVVILDDLVEQTPKDTNLSSSGLRVEPLPNINGIDKDKNTSKRSTYVALHQTRPFVFWQEFLTNIPVKDWHPTIKHALGSMSVFSLVDTHRFRGIWPEAWIYCTGIHIGSEFLAIGDTVRLLPKDSASPGASVNSSPSPTACTDIMIIKSVRVKLTNLDLASSNDYDEGRPYNSQIFVFGRAFTTEKSRSSEEWLENTPSPVAESYHPNIKFYPLHPLDKELCIPFSRLLGRLYEASATSLWFPAIDPTLSHGLSGILESRIYAQKTDRRIVDSFGSSWYWGNSRADALDLRTVNGLEVSNYDTERDLESWRQCLKILNAAMEEEDKDRAKSDVGDEMNVGRGLRAFVAQEQGENQHSLPIHNPQGQPHTNVSRLGGGSVSASVSGPGSISASALVSISGSGSGTGSKKRTKVIDLSSDNEGQEAEIQAQTRIIDDDGSENRKGKEPKKAKVMVVISP
ncbi:hypothetical protein B0J11DRAFT_22481 [Dendryphion nanum]|uniref:Cryptic loci regulator 2 N-terminal domain-containing protein n=1 Tax=Dendryphion nanum TaxID=256645 RepID=A0A9P9J1G7_9PLEO|nr:hypothetical protein B0J11DRAFT_22481 [Dendryphion nanum]